MGGSWNPDYGSILEKTGYGVLCLRDDRNLTIAQASDSFYRALGYRRGEIAALLESGGPAVLQSERPVDWDGVREEIRRHGWACPELRLIRRDGHHLWAAYRVCLEPDGAGGELFCGVTEDITLARRARHLQREQARELAALTDNVPVGVLRCLDDEGLTLHVVSDGFCRFTGYTRGEIAEKFGNRFLPMVHPQDRGLLSGRFAGPGADAVSELTYRLQGRDGRVIWVLDKARRGSDGEGRNWIYSVLTDVTGTRRAQEELARSEERYRQILEHAAVSVVDYDFAKQAVYCSPVFMEKFGKDVVTHGDLRELTAKSGFIHRDDRADALRWFDAVCRAKKAQATTEYRLRTAGGEYIWCSVRLALFYGPQGEPARMMAIISDIDRRKKETLALREQAEHDLLTGLYNRVTTMRRIDAILAQSGEGDRHALLVIDIDNFKQVNDRMGHLCGDQLITETAEQIRRLFRNDDVTGRVGGDEFVVFIRDVDSDIAAKKAEALRSAFGRLRESTNYGHIVSGSIGISFYPEDGGTYEELFRKADIALYAAKRCGKDAFRVYTRGIESVARIGAKS